MYPIFPLRTGAEGVVLDQYDKPIPNVKLEASGAAVSTSWILFGPELEYTFHSDKQGRWHTYRRDADRMMIDAYPPAGYGHIPDSAAYHMQDFVFYGEYRTNVVLRLQKIEPPAQPKETK